MLFTRLFRRRSCVLIFHEVQKETNKGSSQEKYCGVVEKSCTILFTRLPREAEVR